MDTTPYWIASYDLPEYPALDRDADSDVVVVGGGITGVTTAYLLTQAGCRVALVERERCATIDTGHTTAHLTHVMDKPLHRLVADFGKDHAREAWRAGRAAIDQIVANIEDQHIACDFRWLPGYYHAPVSEAPDDHIVKTLRHDAELAKEFGFMAKYKEAVPVMARPGVEHADQGAMHPRKYVHGLLRALEGTGSRVYEHTPVESIQDDPLVVFAGGYRLRCEYVVLATHTPLQGVSGAMSALLLQAKLYLYTSYVIGARVPPGSLPEALFWDTGDPYYYLRVDRLKDSDYVIFGGEDHKTGQAKDTVTIFHRLEAALNRLLPEARVDRRWSGQIVETPDGLPYIGETATNQFAATGFVGQGIAFGTLSAMMAVDAYLGHNNPWAELFSPDRKAIKTGAFTYAKENADFPRYLAKRWFTKPHDHSVQSLGRNEGKILSLDGHKVAAYRDERGQVTLLSPVCTHLKCVVAWNAAERTWDCPCHGSRFKATGEVIAGPAEENLRKIDALEHAEARA